MTYKSGTRLWIEMNKMNDKIEQLMNLLQEAGIAHHQAFLEVGGTDADWTIWYADYLVDKLGTILEAKLTRTQIVVLLVELEHQQHAQAPGSHWARYYAKELVARYF